MALLSRFNGATAAGAFYGYTPLFIRASATGGFKANTGGSGSAIVEKGYEKAVRVFEQYGSVVWVSAQNDDAVTVLVDGSTFNTESGAYTTLKTALGAVKDAGTLTLATSSSLAADGQISFTTV